MVTNAIEFDAKIDNDWKISIPVEYREYLSSFSRVILLNRDKEIQSEKKDDSDMQRRIEAFNHLDGLLAGYDVDLDKLKEERLSRQ
jgi:bifunctional DNA-binding transcriptional regulator/antitoxin component of YhaV-PrlF toxin-antitoxin module